jgi:hypothetical protein
MGGSGLRMLDSVWGSGKADMMDWSGYGCDGLTRKGIGFRHWLKLPSRNTGRKKLRCHAKRNLAGKRTRLISERTKNDSERTIWRNCCVSLAMTRISFDRLKFSENSPLT